jgi:hypothetical protein
MQLFSVQRHLYTYSEESENESTYSWRKDDLIYRDFDEKKVKVAGNARQNLPDWRWG